MLGLTEKKISAIPRRVGRRQVNFDSMMARFPENTFARIDRVLADGENRTDLIRKAVEAELTRRERK